jgi:dienelactone hydrolase
MKTPLNPRKLFTFIWIWLLILISLSIYSQLELPSPTGPYSVGRTIFRWVDTSRPEVLTEDPNDYRGAMAFVWYPAVPGTGVDAEYFPGVSHLSESLSGSGEVAGWQALGLRFVRSKSPLNAQPLQGQKPFPVVLLSPGNGTNIEFYSALAGEIASHGYVVVGLNHPYDVPVVELSDGRIAAYNRQQWEMTPADHQAYSAERIKVRTADMLFVLAQLETINSKTDSPFASVLNLDSVAAAGHSLGGLTASEACKADSRFKACINLDGLQRGGPFSMEESAIPPDQPFLFLTKEDEIHPGLIESFEATSQSYWVAVHGAAHDHFADGLVLQPSLFPVPDRADKLMELIQEYTLAFLDQTLKVQAGGQLSGSVERVDISVRVFPSE